MTTEHTHFFEEIERALDAVLVRDKTARLP